MAKEKVDIGKIIDEETERRLEAMQDSSYSWPKKATKWDAVAIVGTILVCLALILWCVVEVSA